MLCEEGCVTTRHYDPLISFLETVAPFSLTLRVLSSDGVIADDLPYRTIPLPFTIGRAMHSNQRPTLHNGLFTSRFISRRHAEIRMEGFQVVIEDMGSINGTYVNGAQIRPHIPVVISEGDLVQFGIDDEDAILNHQEDPEGSLGASPPLKVDSGKSGSINDHVVVVQVSFDPPNSSFHNSSSSSVVKRIDPRAYQQPPFQNRIPQVSRLPTFTQQQQQQQQQQNIFDSTRKPAVILDPLAHRVATVVRKIAALGVGEGADQDGSGLGPDGRVRLFEVLERFEQDLAACHEIDKIQSAVQTKPSYRPWPDHLATVAFQPKLPVALNVIKTYEMIFCLMAFMAVTYVTVLK